MSLSLRQTRASSRSGAISGDADLDLAPLDDRRFQDVDLHPASGHVRHDRIAAASGSRADKLRTLELQNESIKVDLEKIRAHNDLLRGQVDRMITSTETRRAAVNWVMARFDLSERFTCRMLGQNRATQRYRAKVDTSGGDSELREWLHWYARVFPQSGYRGAYRLARADGRNINHKKLRRLWREEGLSRARPLPRPPQDEPGDWPATFSSTRDAQQRRRRAFHRWHRSQPAARTRTAARPAPGTRLAR